MSARKKKGSHQLSAEEQEVMAYQRGADGARYPDSTAALHFLCDVDKSKVPNVNAAVAEFERSHAGLLVLAGNPRMEYADDGAVLSVTVNFDDQADVQRLHPELELMLNRYGVPTHGL